MELANEESLTRFILDRGDIYCDSRLPGTEVWVNEQLLFSHHDETTGKYSLLINAIKNFISSCDADGGG